MATMSLACGFHNYLPQKTEVDKIIESDHIVTARNSIENPFQYQVVETLRDGGRDVIIPQLVDSLTRNKLVANPEEAVLFGYNSEQETWERISYLTPEFRRLTDTVLSSSDTWGPNYTAERLAVFEALQDHPDTALRMLALREIDQAPYELLQTMQVRIPDHELLDSLWSQQGYPYQPIRVLLLGLAGGEAARSEIYDFLNRVSDWSWANNLGAFATAAVEIDGVKGVDYLEEVFLSDPSQPLDKLEQVVEAFAIHSGLGTPDVVAAVGAAINRLVAQRAEAAPLVARQFGNRQNWSQATVLETVVKMRTPMNGQDLLTVAVYVAQGRAAKVQPAYSEN